MGTRVMLHPKMAGRLRQLLVNFPHQLFDEYPAFDEKTDSVALIEEPLFLGDPAHPTRFHKQKLWLHRATMKRFAKWVAENRHKITYVGYRENPRLLAAVFVDLSKSGVTKIL